MRVIYVAGVNQRRNAVAADSCPYWLLSVSLLPKKGISSWLEPYLRNRRILWDPGTFSEEARTFSQYRRWLDAYAGPGDQYLSYDEIGGDPDLNLAYLRDMRRRRYKPIPIYHDGMPDSLLTEPLLALGGLVPMSGEARTSYLDKLFYGRDQKLGHVHLLGVGREELFKRYPAGFGDNTSWLQVPLREKRRDFAAQMVRYGEREIQLCPPTRIQGRLAL